MKKLFTILVAATSAFALFFSCTVKEINEPVENLVPDGYVAVNLSASMEAVKSAIDGEGHTVWSEGDELAIFWEGGQGTASLASGAGNSTAVFTAVIPEGKQVSYAVYPSDAAVAADFENSTVSVSVPAEQAGSFAAGNIAVAKEDAGNLAFYNVNSFLSVQLISDDITKIEVESVYGSPFAGTQLVYLGGETPELGAMLETSSVVSMTAGVAGTYYISVLGDIVHSEGFLLKYYKGDMLSGTYHLNKSVTTLRSKGLSFGEFEPDGNYYVTVEGQGKKNGVSWENAMSKDQLWSMLALTGSETEAEKAAKLAAIDGAFIHMGGGEYVFGDTPLLSYDEENPVTLTFIGDYPATGGVQDRTDPANRAYFSGAEAHAALILRGKIIANFDGIGFKDGYTNDDEEEIETSGSAPKVAAALDAVGEGVFINMSYCDVKENDHNANGNWGAGIRLNGVGSFSADHVVFADNSSPAAPALSIRNTNVSVTDCEFNGNEATTSNSGAVYISGTSEAVFTSCIFDGNAATAKNGGAVHQNQYSTSTFTDCIFTNNIAFNDDSSRTSGEGYGGAINVVGSSSADPVQNPNITIENCTFSGNMAWRGGCIHVAATGTASVTGCTFSGNGSPTTTRGGGVAYTESDISFTDCTFGGENAEDANQALWGGAIHNVGGITSIFTSTFQNNVAAGGGGAVCAEKCLRVDYSGGGTSYFLGNSVTGTAADKNNHASNGGGAIWAETYKTDSGKNVSVKKAVFKGNHAVSGGAALVYGNSTGCNFYDCTFGGTEEGEANYSTGNEKNHGGGSIYLRDKCYCTVRNCTFTNEHAMRYAGSVFANNSGNFIVEGCTFTGCYSSNGWGGAINTSSGSLDNLTIKGSSFIGCHSNCGGAVLTRISSGKVAITDYNDKGCLFKGNYADHATAVYCGGALQIEGKSTVSEGTSSVRVTIWKADFIDNYSGNGGAIYSKNSGKPDIYIDRCFFDGNYITKEWGAVMATDGLNRLNINNVSIRNSYTTSTDAGRQTDNKPSWIAIYGNPSAFSISNSTIIGDPQYSADGESFTPLPSGNGLINYGGSTTLYLINNIIATNTPSIPVVYGDTGAQTVDLRYNQYGTATNVVTTDNGGNVSGLTASDFDGLSWAGRCWQWSGTVGGVAPDMITAEDFLTRLSAVNEAYVTWIASPDDHYDYYGTNRGDGYWWPGAYQPAVD